MGQFGSSLVLEIQHAIPAEDLEYAERLIARQPDADLLRRILGLVPEPERGKKPGPILPDYCEKHQQPKVQKTTLGRPSGWRCNKCAVEQNRTQRQRKRAAA